jgi:hypothetical protein
MQRKNYPGASRATKCKKSTPDNWQRDLGGTLEAYQQDLPIARRLADQDTSNTGWQRDLINSLYNAGMTTAKIGGNDNITQAKEFFGEALDVVDKYSGPDRRQLVDGLNQALLQLFHSD